MNPDFVSVIIPAYNAEYFVEECVLSVINQSFSNLEIIIINDGSTDNTLNLVKKLQDVDKRIQIITIKNCGRAAARNHGIKAAKGNWLAFLDADDVWIKTKLEKQLIVASEQQADFIYTQRTWVDDESQHIEQPKKTYLPCGLIFEKLIEGNYVCTSTVLVKTNAVRLENGFSELPTFTNVQDYDLWLRLSHNSIFHSLDEELCLYRIHEDNAHKNIRNRFIGLRGCIETMKSGLVGYDLETSKALNRKIQVRDLEISQNFVRGLFHSNANIECLSALKSISLYSKLTLKQRIFQIISYVRMMVNQND